MIDKNTIKEKVIRAYTPIRITSYAYEKASYISRRTCDLAKEPLEVGFYLIGDRLEPDKEIVINDVIVGHDQVVVDIHCDITPGGNIKSHKMVRDIMKKRIVGWGHSHGKLDPYYSPEDKDTINKLTERYQIKKNVETIVDLMENPNYKLEYFSDQNKKGFHLSINGERHTLILESLSDHTDEHNRSKKIEFFKGENIEVPFFYGMTFNAENQKPWGVISYIYNGETYLIEDIGHKIIEDGQLTVEDKRVLDKDLVTRIDKIRKKYSYLEDELDKDFSHFRDNLVQTSKILKALAGGSTITIDTEEKNLSQVCNLIQSNEGYIERYDPEKLILFPNEQKLIIAYKQMQEHYDEFITNISTKKEIFEKRLIELAENRSKEEKGMVGSLRKFGFGKIKTINSIESMYKSLIDLCRENQDGRRD